MPVTQYINLITQGRMAIIQDSNVRQYLQNYDCMAARQCSNNNNKTVRTMQSSIQTYKVI